MRGRRLVIALALVGACSRGQDPTVEDATRATTSTAPPGSTTTSTAPVAAVPDTTAAPATTAVPGQPATATCPAVPARTAPAATRPSYSIDMTVDLDGNVVEGRLTVRFTPDLPTDHLVFRLWPNGPRLARAGARLDVDAVYLGGTAPVPIERRNATTLVVPLADPLAAGETIEATVPWRLTLPGAVSDRISRRGDTVRLGTFHPVLSWEPGIGWGMEPPTSLFAEAWVTPVADWTLAVNAPPGVEVVANGELVGGRWHASAVREVAVALGRFRTVTGTANAPHPVAVRVSVEGGLADDPESYRSTITRALEDFAGRFGPYPYDRYTLVVTPDLAGGIEYPAFVHQGPDTGGRTTPHEVGHQWFYSLVGSHAGRDPWLDEGLATYAEARYLGNLGEFTGRSIPSDARGRAGEPMTYWELHASSYYRGTYVQGAKAIAAMGPEDLVDCALRHYVARNAHAIARNRHAIDSFRVVFPDAEAVLARYGIVAGA